MLKVSPTLEIPSVDGPLDFEKQERWNSHMGRSLSEGSALLAHRVNGLLPKDGSEAFTGNLVVLGSLTVGANLTPIGANGSVVDSVTAAYSTNTALTTILPVDDTIPTNTEGDQILTVAITPKAITNKLRCRFSGNVAASAVINIGVAMFQGSTCMDAAYVTNGTANGGNIIAIEAEYTPGSLSSQTISIRSGPGTAGTIRWNGTSAGRIFGGAANATLVVEEIKA